MKKTSLRQLMPEEFDAAMLEHLTLEGRVFIEERECNRDAYKHEVLEYVEQIREFVAENWREEIGGLWQEIVDAECLSGILMMKYGAQGGHMNRYQVTNIVNRMQSNGIYRQDVPMVVLHKRMERTTQKNRYYKGVSSYKLTRQAAIYLKKLFSRDKNL